MRKCFLTILFVFMISSVSYGASSEDIYVRKDVFEIYMQNIDLKIDKILTEVGFLREEIKKQQEEIKKQREEIKIIREDLHELAKGMVALSERVNGVENRMGDLRQDIYLGLVILGLLAAFPAAKEFFKWREDSKDTRTQSFTLEDVKRLIAEAITEAKLK